jgi:hypothetical protein
MHLERTERYQRQRNSSRSAKVYELHRGARATLTNKKTNALQCQLLASLARFISSS